MRGRSGILAITVAGLMATPAASQVKFSVFDHAKNNAPIPAKVLVVSVGVHGKPNVLRPQ